MKFFATIRDWLRKLFRRSSPDDYAGNPIPAPLPWEPSTAPPAISTPTYSARDMRITIQQDTPQAARMKPTEIPEWVCRQCNVPPAIVAHDDGIDGIDAFCTALRHLGEAAAAASAALGAAVRAVIDATLINRYGTAKEIHYITHGRKARTRKKYRNRVLRRVRRAERRKACEDRTPCT